MADRKRLAEIERKIEAKEILPIAPIKDNKSLNIRGIIIKWHELGIRMLSEQQINLIRQVGYDEFIVQEMNSLSKIGSSRFVKLSKLDMLEFTLEYLVFHNFRDSLDRNCRTKIAGLLAAKAIKNQAKKD